MEWVEIRWNRLVDDILFQIRRQGVIQTFYGGIESYLDPPKHFTAAEHLFKISNCNTC